MSNFGLDQLLVYSSHGLFNLPSNKDILKTSHLCPQLLKEFQNGQRLFFVVTFNNPYQHT